MSLTKMDAEAIMERLKTIGIRTKLIGSVKSKGTSKNDIDLVLLDYPVIKRRLVSKIETNFSIMDYAITDWGGILIETVLYGKIDLFPNSFMKKCYYCKKKCCALSEKEKKEISHYD